MITTTAKHSSGLLEVSFLCCFSCCLKFIGFAHVVAQPRSDDVHPTRAYLPRPIWNHVREPTWARHTMARASDKSGGTEQWKTMQSAPCENASSNSSTTLRAQNPWNGVNEPVRGPGKLTLSRWTPETYISDYYQIRYSKNQITARAWRKEWTARCDSWQILRRPSVKGWRTAKDRRILSGVTKVKISSEI